MKKILSYFVAIIAVAVIVTSCGGSASTPSKAAEKMIRYMQNEDYESFSKGLYLGDDNQSGNKEHKEFAAMLESKAVEKSEDEVVKSFKILDEEISEDGTEARVEVDFTYADGSTDTETMKFTLDSNGEWKMNIK